jgi:formylmethanofuran dehydrogenase subunit C
MHVVMLVRITGTSAQFMGIKLVDGTVVINGSAGSGVAQSAQSLQSTQGLI